ncbi:unnamed protein product [Symbiodinium sp. CCMP2456]|nr:unnamed protein product [Symbiodinium sp. CCMP2456]
MAKQGWILRALSTVTSRSRKKSAGSCADIEEDDEEKAEEPRSVPCLPSAPSSALFAQDAFSMPSVGGCVNIQHPHSKNLLPEEVVLFEPSVEEIFADRTGPRGTRLIFLNTPLSEAEVQALAALRKEWATRRSGRDDLPEFIRLSALRVLQHKKFDVSRAIDLIQTCLEERVRRLPLQEADILQDLSCGAMYWHGRDRKCRPCLVVRIERFADLIKDKERCVRMTIFVLEYAIRYAMVPGRVENWVVLVDCENLSDVVSFFQLPTMCLTAKALSQTLESVYCCRMVWVKLLNLPTILRSIVQSVIPAEKKKKVCAIEDPSKELLKYFEPNQLEARYGGTRPDLKPHETYPFHFFPGCTGSPTASGSRRIMTCESDRSTASTESGQSTAASSEEVACLANLEPATSLHHLTGRKFHEGQLWDTSVRDRWSADATKSSLTWQAAQVLSAMLEQEVLPCCTMQQWKELAACEGTKKQEAPAVLLGSQAVARSKEPAEAAIPKERRQLSQTDIIRERRTELISL